MTATERDADRHLLHVGRSRLRIEDLVALAEGRVEAALDPDPTYRAGLAAGSAAVERVLACGQVIYGVSTGVGASLENTIPDELQRVLPLNLLRFHGCGTGRILEETEAAAVVAARLASLARGYSGVRPVLLERLCEFLNLRLLPRIPAEGSVGASGDLTPLSYLAAALVGEREVTLRGAVLGAADALAQVGLAPLALAPKESLALMNGTSVMTALGCLAFVRAVRLARWAAALTAVGCDVMRGNPAHFEARIFDLKPHPGSRRCAAWIREDLTRTEGGRPAPPARLQDRYSLRCAPHVIGVLLDALDFSRSMIEIEVNGVNDNPIIDPESGDVFHGGNFYGGHVCFALDGLKAAVASVADLLDRQLALLCDPATNGGLPANLVAASGPERVAHHAFKAMQITASALAAEALKLTMPASAFSRSTESHNQDKVSMGTIAARDCLRVVELAETVASIGTLAACQGVDLRGGEADALRSRALRDAVRKAVPQVLQDRRQDHDISRVLELHAAGDLLGRDLDVR
ncbi:MAG TPA: histidine ammonia-lyase [Deltaproteobacteria bacterium]|nr:histidine ammonia-lyase [Deltaproteobacteria bacterium]